jgi:hypothetical protein
MLTLVAIETGNRHSHPRMIVNQPSCDVSGAAPRRTAPTLLAIVLVNINQFSGSSPSVREPSLATFMRVHRDRAASRLQGRGAVQGSYAAKRRTQRTDNPKFLNEPRSRGACRWKAWPSGPFCPCNS